MAEEKNNENEELRIGVYVCHCGVNIAGVVDVEAVAEYAGTLPNVVLSTDYKYMCSDPGQNLIQEDIKKHNLNRIVVAACSPRLHEPTFRRCVEEAGLNRYLFEFANLREHDSWVHMGEPEPATEKAKDLTRMAVAKARLLEPLNPSIVDVNNEALVIGGGVTGIQTALDLADMGFKTYMVERNPTIGGRMGQLDKTFPTLDCSMCILAPKMVDCGKHENIELITYAEVTEVDGYIGNFKVTVNKKARYVVEDDCTGCGACTEVCPIEIPNYFDEGIGMTKAAYIPFPQAVPLVATIDKDYCIECKLCDAACERGCIDHDMQDEEIELEVGTIVAATGYDPYDPSGKYEYGYGRYSNVITAMEIERMINASGPTTGHVIKPSDGKTPKRVAFIHCVGSRDEQIGKPYCSRVCCMYSMKNAQLCIDHEPDTDVTCYYMDIRAFGKGFEEFYKTSQEKYGIEFLRGRPAQIIENDDLTLTVRAEDTLLGKVTEYTYDLVVLSVGLTAPEGSNELRQTLGLSKSSDGFYMEAHPKLRPVDTLTDGVYIAGVAQGPKDIPDSVAQGSAAASRAAIPMAQGTVAIEPIIASSDEAICGACEVCVELCPYTAISIVEVDGSKHAAINAALCKGCGTCVGACPSGAMDQFHFKTDQIMAQIDSLAGTAMGIGLGFTPIVPFIGIMKGKENVKIFPESMIFFNILCPHLWCTYWIRQNVFIPFFSAIFGLTLGLIFSTIYIYFYLGKDTLKWLMAITGKFAVVASFHYFLLNILPSYHYIGFAAMVVGIFTSIAPAQNVLKVIRERNHKLIPIWSTVFGALCNFFWLAFGIMLKDVYNIVVNAICFSINFANTCIWIYFYYNRDKKVDEDDKGEELKDEDNDQ